MRPGTVDYSKWDAIHTSSDEDEAPAPPPSKPRAAATQPPAPAASAPPVPPDVGEDDIISRMLPVLVANESAMRALGSDGPKTEPPFFALLPQPLAAALRAVASSNDVARGVARMAVVCRAGRRGAAASPLASLATRELVVKREDVFDAISLHLKMNADADEHARAHPRTYGHDEYASDDEAEWNSLAALLADPRQLVCVLELMASWTEIPPPAACVDDGKGLAGAAAKLAPTMQHNTARQMMLANLKAAEDLNKASAETRRVLSEIRHEQFNEFVAQLGGTPAPMPPPAAEEPQQLSPKQRKAYEGGLMLSMCALLRCLADL